MMENHALPVKLAEQRPYIVWHTISPIGILFHMNTKLIRCNWTRPIISLFYCLYQSSFIYCFYTLFSLVA